ncbi:ribonuclease E/G [Gracilibacillus caseinilyticus]|uniref:Ribonuclease E/G n=1 Tax=Gracilibacillus caseinilyticus TaxID=2932256 RepID=A0ABY4ES91_9BACI|nr:ribonuclease E/G [Gracilibacillus caseinilyticus]UOQ47303.1 ribonuclease E/G [Gracilibacillus caseinilyticus]
MKKIHLTTRLTEKVGLMFEDNTCMDIFIDRPRIQQAALHSIFIGKVRNVDESIEAAFIDIGADKVGFLAKKEVPWVNTEEKLSSYLTEGASVIVQITKEAYQDKGPRLTANITIQGKYIVYLPKGNYIASSKKLHAQAAAEWKAFISSSTDKEEGAILRTDITEAAEEELLQELTDSRVQWRNLQEKAANEKAPALLWHDPLVPNQMLHYYQSQSIQEITFDEPKSLERMKKQFPYLATVMTIRTDSHYIGGKHIDRWLAEAIQPQVDKQDGISLIVEETEALTVIDINSSRFSSRQNKQDTIFKINQLAVRHCVEEIRKRNLSGIIVIDFLKMNKKQETQIIKELNDMLRHDPVRTEVYGFTNLGLLEMTRKRARTGLLQLLTNNTATMIHDFSAETYLYQLEREVVAFNRHVEGLVVACQPELYRSLQERPFHETASFSLELYIYIDNEITGYQIIRSGSKEIVELFIAEHKELDIDKIY